MIDDEKWLSQIKRGMLELCILNLVYQEDIYGYEIVKRLTEAPGLVITVGTIYPLLSRLKREGLLTSSLVESNQGPARRIYRLTRNGKQNLRNMNEAWAEIARSMEGFIGPNRNKMHNEEKS
jgi:PadR family transcriptional regulator PadR